MSTDNYHFNSIAIEALSLSIQERGDLAARLLSSLDPDRPPNDEAHLAIVHERMKQYEACEMTSRPTEAVIKEMRKKFCW